MKNIYPNHIYHIYNRGNNKQRIFFKRENYLYFLHKIRTYVRPHCDILSYCLMPNHFHFLIYTTERTLLDSKRNVGNLQMNVFSEGWQLLLSSYTKAINKQEGRTGSLFQQNTNSRQVSDDWMSLDYRLCCFSYIHLNPTAARLVNVPEDWEYSSYRDYIGLRNGTLCNIQLGYQLMGFDKSDLKKILNRKWDDNIQKEIW
jgi:REP element-mobilizing transposase RayT